MMKTTISEFKQKYPKLILPFERTTGKYAIWGNNLSKNFIYWLRQKIKYKDGFICNICGREFDNKYSLNSHSWSHDKEKRKRTSEKIGRAHEGKTCSEETKKKMSISQKESQNISEIKEKHSKAMKEVWNRPGYRERMSKVHKGKKFSEEHKRKLSGKNHPNYGKFGKESSAYKEYVGVTATHTRVRKIKVKPELCELCGLPEFYENLGKLELSNIKNHIYTDNPDDYQYTHHSCHMKYDSYN